MFNIKFISIFKNSIFCLHNNTLFVITTENINLKLLKESQFIGEYTFNTNEIITIGRNMHCNVKFNDDTLSKMNTTIKFENGKWTIFDGNGKGKHSTNGTWIQLKQNTQEFQIYNGMEFKLNNEWFKCFLS